MSHAGLALDAWEPEVAWTEPQYSREDVNAAATTYLGFGAKRILTVAEYEEYNRALYVINNWRTSHNYPLNTFQVGLRSYARKVDDAPLVAQRTKRMSSIEAKLRRFPDMKLSQMQDIGGCRAVVHSIHQMRALVDLYRDSSIKHEIASFDDYITNPPKSGYRGAHLVYRYFSDKNKKMYNGLKIEVQLRSQYQHAWATAVETVGTFIREALKSSVGHPEWLRFFALMGTAIAHREGTPPVPATPVTRQAMLDELRHLSRALNVSARLKTFSDALRTLGTEQLGMQHVHYYLLELDPEASQLTVTGFHSSQLQQASDRYLEAEKKVKQNPGTDAVLVSVDSVTALERAYPNYYADTRVFRELLSQTLSKRPGPIKVPPRPREPANAE